MARSYRSRKRSLQEEQQAIDWLRAAAESGHRGAMVDLGVVNLQGVKRIGLQPAPYRARVLFERALRDREDVVYTQQTGDGRGWKYTVESVNGWLERVPRNLLRLDLEGLEGVERRQAIEQWYLQEQRSLRSQITEPSGEAPGSWQQRFDDLELQRAALLSEEQGSVD